MVWSRHKDTLVAILVLEAAAALQVRLECALALAVEHDLGASDAAVFVRVDVGGYADERILDLVLEGEGSCFVLHVGGVVELGVLALEGGAPQQLHVLVSDGVHVVGGDGWHGARVSGEVLERGRGGEGERRRWRGGGGGRGEVVLAGRDRRRQTRCGACRRAAYTSLRSGSNEGKRTGQDRTRQAEDKAEDRLGGLKSAAATAYSVQDRLQATGDRAGGGGTTQY